MEELYTETVIALEPSSYVRRLVESQLLALIHQDGRKNQKEPLCPEPSLNTCKQPFLLINHLEKEEPFSHKYHQLFNLTVYFHKISDSSPINGMHRQYIVVSLKATELNGTNYFPITQEWPRKAKYPLDKEIQQFPSCAPWDIFDIHPSRTATPPKHLRVVNLELPIEQFRWKSHDKPTSQYERFFPSTFSFISRSQPPDFIYGMSQDLSTTSKSHLPHHERLPYPHDGRRGNDYSFDSVMNDEMESDRHNLVDLVSEFQKRKDNKAPEATGQLEKEQSSNLATEFSIDMTNDTNGDRLDALLNGPPLGTSPTLATIGDLPTSSIAVVDDISDAIAKRASSSTADDENSPAAQQTPAASANASGGAIALDNTTGIGGTFQTRQDDAAKNLPENSNLVMFLEETH